MINDQGSSSKITDPLKIVDFLTHRERGSLMDMLIHCQFSKADNLCCVIFLVPACSFLHTLYPIKYKLGLVFWTINNIDSFALDTLDVAVFCKKLDGAPDGIAGTVKFFDQSVFRWQEAGRRIFFMFNSLS